MTRSRRARPVAGNGLDGLDGLDGFDGFDGFDGMSQFLTAAADARGNADTELGNGIRG